MSAGRSELATRDPEHMSKSETLACLSEFYQCVYGCAYSVPAYAYGLATAHFAHEEDAGFWHVLLRRVVSTKFPAANRL